jgi:hypothetical protein
VAVLNSGGEVGPPSTRESTKLLGREQDLLDFRAVQKPKLGLNDAKLVIRLQQINCLGKCQRVRRQEIGVGSLHPWLAVGRAHLTLHEVLRQHLMSSFCVANSCSRLTGDGGGGGGGGEFHEQHYEAHSLLPQHEHWMTQARPE